MPTKFLTSQTGRKMIQATFKFGGGKNEIRAEDDMVSGYGYIINAGGGDDMIFGSDFTTFAGTGTIVDPRTLNGDLLIGGDGSDLIEGGLGNDTIFGGNEDGSDSAKGKDAVPSNSLFGDDRFASTSTTYTAGDDVLVGGADGFNTMVGDVQSAGGSGTFFGGNDILISGMNANDTMVGDFGSGAATQIGGEDTFVFGLSNGADQIIDFRSTDDDDNPENGVGDTINLAATGLVFTDLDDNILGGDGVLDGSDSHVTVTGTTMVIDLGAANNDGTSGVNTLTLFNVTSLTADDFDFVNVIDPGDALV